MLEPIEHGSIHYVDVIRGGAQMDKTTFFSPAESSFLVPELTRGPGDAIVLMHGVHCLRAFEDMQCITATQGPFLVVESDKVDMQVDK